MYHPEYLYVEAPFIRQLQTQGWKYLTECGSFQQVHLTNHSSATLR
jgi:hypothetical protein